MTVASYTEDEIADIDAQYAREAPRGADPRWWEDVAVGDEIGPLVKGPLTVTDMVCWHVGMGMGLYGVRPLRLGWRNRQRIPRFYHRDELGIPDVMQRVHWDPAYARKAGNPTTFDYGRMRETWLIHLCTDWMGDDAWLWRLDCEFRKFNYVGDTQWMRGRVTQHYLADGDRPAIDLDVWAENQRGEVTTPGHATILLPSREHGPVRLPDPPDGATDLQGALTAIAALRARLMATHESPAYESSEGLVVELADGVLRITLDRPAKRNALDDSMITALNDHLERVNTDESVRAIWLTSNGDDFCSGFDLSAATRPVAPDPVSDRCSGGCRRKRTGSSRSCSRRRCPSCARPVVGWRASASISPSQPTSASRRATRASGSRSPRAGSHPTAAERG